MIHWRLSCAGKEVPALGQRCFKNQCVVVAWRIKSDFTVEGKGAGRDWRIATKALKGMGPGDKVFVQLKDNRVARVSQWPIMLLLFLLLFSFCASAQTPPQQPHWPQPPYAYDEKSIAERGEQMKRCMEDARCKAEHMAAVNQQVEQCRKDEKCAAAERHKLAKDILMAHWSDFPFEGREEWEQRYYDTAQQIKDIYIKNPGLKATMTEDEWKQLNDLNIKSMVLLEEGVLRAAEERRIRLLVGHDLSTPELVNHRMSLESLGFPPPEIWVKQADQELEKRGLRFDEKSHSVQTIQEDKKQ